MALYTKQQLIDAYCASTGCDSSKMPEEIIRVQAEIDARIDKLTTKKAEVVAAATAMASNIQNRINNIEPDAKERIKDIALAYLVTQIAAQNETDNESVNL